MDKNEYRAKLDEINDLVDRQDYKGALKIVDTIDWRRVRSARTLCMVGEIYEANKCYEDSRKLLLMAHHRAPIGRTVIYRLVELSIKMGNFDEAADYYKQFVEISPNDDSRYILKYKLARAKRAPLEEQISILKEYKSKEYTERWAYELAKLYAKAGKKEACIEECDDLILWFSEGKYVTKAMELKMKFTPLTPIQQDKYDHRFQKGYTPGVAAKAVAAAAQAAEDVVKAAVPASNSQDSEIDDILKSVIGNETSQSGSQAAKENASPQISDTQDLKDKAAQEILDVLPGRSIGEEEAAATKEQTEKKEYVVKDLEPETFGNPSELKPFHMGGAMKPTAKVQAPQSQLFREEDMNPEDFKTDLKEKELDLEALLAETASELAQAVAEETESSQPAQEEPEAQKEEVQEPEAQEEQIREEETQEVPEAEQEPETENPEEEEETSAQEEIPAPAAAKSAMVADAIASALMEKAEEFEKDAKETLEDTREIVTEEILDTEYGLPVVEAVEEAEFEEENVQEPEAVPKEIQEPVAEPEEAPEKTEESAAEPEEAPEEIQEPVTEPEAVPEKIQEPVSAAEEIPEEIEEPAEVSEVMGEPVAEPEEIPEAEEADQAETEETSEIQEESQIDLQETKVIPDDEVREALGEIDLSSALEQELEDTVLPKEQGEQEETEEPVEEPAQETAPVFQPAAFGTAVEGLMRHHLTEEEHRRLFTYFAPVPGMSQQINEVLDTAQESACAKTSQAGNIIVTGREGSGKTKLSEGLIKALCKERQMQGAKVAYIEAEELNKKDPAAVVDKLSGGFLVVEHAGALEEDIVENMSKAMEFKTNRLTVILEDLKPGIRDLEEKYPEFMKKFDSRIVIPVFTNDELVSFAKTYAKELGYKIDDMAVLALYTLIGDNQNEENPVSIGMVREMMDAALKKAARKGRRPGKRVSKRHLDETGRIMLYEKDFDI